MTHDDQIRPKPVQYLVKRETALPSLKYDCHLCLALSGNHQFAVRKKVVGKNVVKTLEPFLFGAVQPNHVPSGKKPITRNAKPLSQQFFSDMMMRIRLGVENHKTIFPTELIWFSSCS